MSGITSGVGIFSGIDTASLIEQLLAVESRPKIQFQQRIVNLQLIQSGYLDVNSRLSALETAAAAFRTNKTFDAKTATTSDDTTLTATAGTGAAEGSYSFLVDRLVTTRQLLTKGFSDRDVTAFGASQFTFEGFEGRLDRDVQLADLNAGAGIERGTFTITIDSTSAVFEIDLSKAATLGEALDAINSAGSGVTASVQDGSVVLTSSEAFTVADSAESATATNLGIVGSSATSGSSEVIGGTQIYAITTDTPLSVLNDGNGVFVGDEVSQTRSDLSITIGTGIPGGEVTIDVNIGPVYDADLEQTEPAATTIGAVIDRINQAIADEGTYPSVTVGINAAGNGLVFDDGAPSLEISVAESDPDSTTARDLGLLDVQGAAHDGAQILAGLNTTLVSNLNGGAGITGSGIVDFTDRNGVSFSTDISGFTTVAQIIDQINTDAQTAGADISVALNEPGTGLLVSDTSGGTGNLIVTGDSASDLGIDTGAPGVAEDSVIGSSLQHAYVTNATLLSELNNGQGIGTGKFRITDSSGRSHEVNIGDSVKNVRQLIEQIEGQTGASNLAITVRINDNGDGIVIEEDTSSGTGTLKLKIEDTEGVVARNLRIAGEAADTGADNFIDGSYETVVTFEPGDTLDEAVQKINDAGAGVDVSVINDGSSSTPFRLSVVSERSGVDGRFTLDTHGFELGLNVLERGDNARVFFGSSDPAKAVLLQSSSNTLDSVLSGVSIDLKSTSSDPVELTIAGDTATVETAIQTFVDAFNEVISRIDQQTSFDSETEQRGALLGDSTVISLRQTLFNTVLGEGDNLSGQFTALSQVGVRFGTDGQLTFDSDRFRQVLEQDPDAVAALFETRDLVDNKGPQEVSPGVFVSGGFTDDEFSSLGVMGKVEELIADYINSIDGILTERNRTLDNQIQAQEDRIADFDLRLERRREILQRQFVAMEQAIAQIQSQQSSLAGLSLGG